MSLMQRLLNDMLLRVDCATIDPTPTDYSTDDDKRDEGEIPIDQCVEEMHKIHEKIKAIG